MSESLNLPHLLSPRLADVGVKLWTSAALVWIWVQEIPPLVLLMWSVIALFVLLLLVIVMYRARNAPGVARHPKWIPIIGVLHDVIRNKDRIHDWENEAHEEIGGSFQISAWGPRQTWIVASPTAENVRHILKTNFANYHIPLQRKTNFAELFGKGIFASDGPSWHRQRKSASHLFTGRDMRTVVTDVFVEHGRQFVEHLVDAGRNNRIVDLHNLFFRFTMDCFSEIAFSNQAGGLDLAKKGEEDAFGGAFDRAQSLMTDRYFNPLWQFERAFRLPFGREAGIRREMRAMNGFVNDVIRTRMQEGPSGGKPGAKRQDLVHHFLKLMQTDPELREKSNQAKVEDLRDMVVNFIVAGRDTTACALSWFFYELTRNPDVEQRVREELSEVTGRALSNDPVFGQNYRHAQHPTDTKLGIVSMDYQVASRLPYLEATIRETLRLHPSVPYDAKQAVKADILPDNTPIPAGSVVTYSPYVAGRSTETWGPDALEFRPERWLEPGKNGEQYSLIMHNPYMYPTFNAGPRICLGQSLALLESKMLISMLLQRLTFRLSPDAKIQYRTTVTLQMVDGLPATVLESEHWSPHINPDGTKIQISQAHLRAKPSPPPSTPPASETKSQDVEEESPTSAPSPIQKAVWKEEKVHEHLDVLMHQVDGLLINSDTRSA